MTELASYVEQSDALLGVLTVEETIRFAARLRYVSFFVCCIRSTSSDTSLVLMRQLRLKSSERGLHKPSPTWGSRRSLTITSAIPSSVVSPAVRNVG